MNKMKKAHEIRKAAAEKWGCKVSEICFSECLRMAHNGEEINTVTDQQLALQKGIKDTAEHFKNNTLCESASNEIYEQLAMIYMAHRSSGSTHEAACEKSFARLNGNGVSNSKMVELAEKTIAAQAVIVAQVKEQAGL